MKHGGIAMKHLKQVLRSGPVLLAFMIIGIAPHASAQQIPPGCSGSGITITIQAFLADGTTSAVGTAVSPCETLVFDASMGYALLPPGNCSFEQGALVLTTPDGVDHNVSPLLGIFDPLQPGLNQPLGPLAGLLIAGLLNVNTHSVTYVVNPADAKGACAGGSNDGTACTLANQGAVCTGGGTCQGLEVTASTSYNQSPSFPLGVSFNNAGPPQAGFNSGFAKIPVSVAPCGGTFCAPQICDPTAQSDPPGRTGLCVAGTPPVCPVVPPDDQNPLCFQATCDVPTDKCVTTAIEPPPSICRRIPCGNRGSIARQAAQSSALGAAAATGRLDKLSLALRPATADPIDPTGMDVTVLMSTDNGQFFSATLPAGSLKKQGNYYKYRNSAASTQGGISRLTIWRKRYGKTQIYADAYGDLSGAKSVMDSAVVIGGVQYNHDGTWTAVPNGWKFP
jgi:hypothetical protein